MLLTTLKNLGRALLPWRLPVVEERPVRAPTILPPSRDTLATLIDNLPLWMALVDREGRYVAVNRRYVESFGLPVERIVGRHYSEVLPPNLAARHGPLVEACLAGETVAFEDDHTADPVLNAWVRGVYQPLRDSAGEVTGLAVYVEDITGRKQAEQALEASRRELRDILDESVQGFWRVDGERRTVDVNPALCRMLGYTRAEMLGRTPVEFCDGGDRDLLAWLMSQMATQHQQRFEVGLRHRDGRRIPAFLHANNGVDAAGRLLGGFAFVTDLTERKAAEEQLRQSEARYRQLFDASPAVKLILDPADGCIVEVNRAACSYYGYSREQLLGLHARAICDLPDDTFAGYVAEILAGGPPAVIQTRHRLANGDAREVEVHAGTLELEGRTRIYATVYDITDRRRAEAALRVSEASLRRAQAVAHLGSWTLELGSGALHWSEEVYRLFGLPVGSPVTYEQFLAAVHPDDRPVVAAGWRAALAGTPYDLEHRICVDGEVRWVRELAELTFDEHGRAVTGIGTVQDITAQKHAEEQLQLAAQVFANSREAIIITDARGAIVAVNLAFTEITGWPEEEVLGRRAWLLRSHHHDATFYRALRRSVVSSGYWQGEVWSRRRDGSAYPSWMSVTAVRGTDGEVSHYIGIATDMSEHKAAEERIRTLAYYDMLTGLPNRALLAERAELLLDTAERDGSEVALLFIDLDHFKTVNDSLGHSMGDILLQAVATRLRELLRESDTVARLGGDEFVLLLPRSGPESALRVARKVLEAAQAPYPVGGHHLTVTPSIGISVFPRDATVYEGLLQHADAAMYRAKADGRNTYQFFTAAMNQAAFERLVLESSLRGGVARGEFVLHYQPQMEISSGRLVGAEALLRWNHPELGLVPPDRFIPLAEETGLIAPIGDWVLREACRQNRAWQAAGLPPLPVAVNLSAVQFRHGGLAEAVAAALAESGLEPRYLELELTESILMSDTARTLETLGQLREMGVGLSIDDFGTGYSSLFYLKRFPIQKLKIDRSFVRDLAANADDRAIAAAVVSLGRSLRLRVIAEGVESIDQLSILREQGCDEVQGYLLARPLPAEEFAAALRNGFRLPR